jgi:hypothetical protein
MRTLLAIAAVAALVLLLGGTFLPIDPPNAEAHRQAILAIDYSKQLDNLKWLSPDESPFLTMLQKSELEGLELTPFENRLAGRAEGYKNGFDFHSLTSRACGYDMEHGQLPQTAVDLFPEILSDADFAAFMAETPEQQLERLLPVVNPVTNHVYATFASKEWSPGGIFIERISDEELRTPEYANFRDKATHGLPWMWRVKVWGELPGKVLKETKIGLGNEFIDPTYGGNFPAPTVPSS